jgi:Phage phiEco32-like COOH.NH2 ligase-type 2
MLKLGCDPEIFLRDMQGAITASCDKIGGSKDYPRPLPIGDGYAIQEDNVAIEFNIPPATSSNEWVNSINKAMSYIRKEIADIGLTLTNESALLFPMDQLMHPAALEFGCDPDFNAWDGGKMNPRPEATDKTLRSAGGHVHIGLDTLPKGKDALRLIKLMDLFCSVPAVRMDSGILRKELYGKAGAFRGKPYGLEYRSLSNFWIFDDKLVDWVWQSTNRAVDAWHNKTINPDDDKDAILEAINTNNLEIATQLIGKYNLTVV